jgi:hypothetical protein
MTLKESELFIYMENGNLYCKQCREELPKIKMEEHVRDNHMGK